MTTKKSTRSRTRQGTPPSPSKVKKPRASSPKVKRSESNSLLKRVGSLASNLMTKFVRGLIILSFAGVLTGMVIALLPIPYSYTGCLAIGVGIGFYVGHSTR